MGKKNIANHAYLQGGRLALAVAAAVACSQANADTVTNWNYYTTLATKGATPAAAVAPASPARNSAVTAGTAAIALNSNVATRIEAIEARAVYDAVNAIDHFSRASYYYAGPAQGKVTAHSASAAAAQAAHDVLLAVLPAAAPWTATRSWLDAQLASDLASLGVGTGDAGIAAGQSAATAAVAARKGDFAAIRTTYIPSTNISPTGTATDQGNPGPGIWRPSNGGAGAVDPLTGSPTGFAAGVIQPAAAIDFNWKNVTPFSLSTLEKQQLVAEVPASLDLAGKEYASELAYVRTHGQDSANPGSRTPDQLAQALFYRHDAELTVNELARLASAARGLTLDRNAQLFALVDSLAADARIAAWQSKYDLVFWRPVTALNADASGSTAPYTYAWKPLAATPSHPSSTSGHSATVAAGVEALRAFFGADEIVPGGAAQELTTFAWLIGAGGGTGLAGTYDARKVSTFSAAQIENGNSRIYLGVHFGIDNYQGQQLGLAIADAVINGHTDPAAAGLSVYGGGPGVATAARLRELLAADSVNSGYFGGQ